MKMSKNMNKNRNRDTLEMLLTMVVMDNLRRRSPQVRDGSSSTRLQQSQGMRLGMALGQDTWCGRHCANRLPEWKLQYEVRAIEQFLFLMCSSPVLLSQISSLLSANLSAHSNHRMLDTTTSIGRILCSSQIEPGCNLLVKVKRTLFQTGTKQSYPTRKTPTTRTPSRDSYKYWTKSAHKLSSTYSTSICASNISIDSTLHM